MIRKTTPRVDNSMPSAYRFPLNGAKKEQQIEERCNQIERSNKGMLARMEDIHLGKFANENVGYGGPPPRAISQPRSGAMGNSYSLKN